MRHAVRPCKYGQSTAAQFVTLAFRVCLRIDSKQLCGWREWLSAIAMGAGLTGRTALVRPLTLERRHRNDGLTSVQ